MSGSGNIGSEVPVDEAKIRPSRRDRGGASRDAGLARLVDNPIIDVARRTERRRLVLTIRRMEIEHPEPESDQTNPCRKQIVNVIEHKEGDDRDEQSS
jgi:hypothetical protein